MKLQPPMRSARYAVAVGLMLGVLAPSVASAQQPPPAPAARDGRTLSDEPVPTRQLFAATHGPTAPQQWQREHNMVIRNDLPVASDGRTIASEPSNTRAAFASIWGADAPGMWAVLHSYALGKALILTGELEEAIEAAEDGDLAEAQGEHRSFATTWEANFEPLVREKIAQDALEIGAQVRRVTEVLITPQNPDRATYLAELHELEDMIEASQARLAALPGSPFTTPAPLPPAAVRFPIPVLPQASPEQRLNFVVDTQELESSMTGAQAGNMARASGEYDEFLEQWQAVRERARAASPTAFAEIEAALAQAGAALRPPSQPTAQDYLTQVAQVIATIRRFQ